MASPALKQAISEAALKYVKPEGKVFQYGTAGVRSSLAYRFFLSANPRLTGDFLLTAVPYEGVSFPE